MTRACEDLAKLRRSAILAEDGQDELDPVHGGQSLEAPSLGGDTADVARFDQPAEREAGESITLEKRSRNADMSVPSQGRTDCQSVDFPKDGLPIRPTGIGASTDGYSQPGCGVPPPPPPTLAETTADAMPSTLVAEQPPKPAAPGPDSKFPGEGVVAYALLLLFGFWHLLLAAGLYAAPATTHKTPRSQAVPAMITVPATWVEQGTATHPHKTKPRQSVPVVRARLIA
jgi:hypothetical protein